jgi:hypothetical protein
LDKNLKYISTVNLHINPYNIACCRDSLLITSPGDKTIFRYTLDLPQNTVMEDAYPNVKLKKPIFMEVNGDAVCVKDGDAIRIFNGKTWSNSIGTNKDIRSITPGPEGFWIFFGDTRTACLYDLNGNRLKTIMFGNMISYKQKSGHTCIGKDHYVASNNIIWKFDETGTQIFRAELEAFRFCLGGIKRLILKNREFLIAFDLNNAVLIKMNVDTGAN